ncbi:glycosyltransferase family 39 protein, partial [Candidatus Aminicenantes bacterium AC-335-G13]|nr:glycosyltransferase family 39 protein [Candidatus Aminicenantes bacterium AC-335-G13]
MVKNFNNHLSEKIILPFLVLLTVIVRISGLKWGLPHLYHVDENRFAKIAIGYFSGDLNPHFFHVPSLHTYLIFISWKILFFFGKIIGRIPQGIKFKDWFEMNPTIPMLAGRFLVALFSIGTIILIYLIGKKIFNQRVGLFASIFLIFSLTHNRLSHSMVPVVPMIFFLVLSFYFIWLIYSKGNLKYYLLAGLFAGLAMATKYGGHLLFIPLFFAHLFSSLERRESLIKIFINFKLILFVLFFLIGFFIGTPYAFFDFSTFWRDFNWQARHLYEAGHYGTSTSQSALIFYLKYGFKRNIGILSQYFAFLGILLGIIRLKRKEIILFSLP